MLIGTKVTVNEIELEIIDDLNYYCPIYNDKSVAPHYLCVDIKGELVVIYSNSILGFWLHQD